MQTEKETGSGAMDTLLIEMEKATLEAYKNKDEHVFAKNFTPAYIGVAYDGVKNATGEIAGMQKFDLTALWLEAAKVNFTTEDTGILTYTMKSQGSMNGKNFSGTIYCATVYQKLQDQWQVVLHTESMAQ